MLYIIASQRGFSGLLLCLWCIIIKMLEKEFYSHFEKINKSEVNTNISPDKVTIVEYMRYITQQTRDVELMLA